MVYVSQLRRQFSLDRDRDTVLNYDKLRIIISESGTLHIKRGELEAVYPTDKRVDEGRWNERFACYRLNQHPHLMNDPLSPTTGQSLFDLDYHDTKNG